MDEVFREGIPELFGIGGAAVEYQMGETKPSLSRFRQLAQLTLVYPGPAVQFVTTIRHILYRTTTTAIHYNNF